MANGSDSAPLLIVDGGTTNTRLWAVAGDRVVHEARVAIGARDGTTPDGRARLAAAVTELIDTAMVRCREQGPEPRGAIAAGMIGSPQGLEEVPHVPAPAGAHELAAGVATVKLSTVSSREILRFITEGAFAIVKACS